MSLQKSSFDEKQSIQMVLNEMLEHVRKNLLDKWYPLAVDKEYGGYFTNITYNWEIEPVQTKMIVTQARYVWAAAKAAMFFNDNVYADAAKHGFPFLKNFMWDQKYGGFFQMRDYKGGFSDYLGFNNEKRTYGNAFAIYGLAALYDLTKNNEVLDFAKEAFNWIEDHSFDPKYKGYFQFISPEGVPFDKNSSYKTKAYDDVELGYKDQNSSIHLLEAYTELFNVWKDEKLKNQLSGLLTLIRDVITTPEGYMNLFFENDWTPISFKDAPKEIRENNYRLDHVSFGHNYETAFLMLEASHALGLKNDTKTLSVAKKMVDHAIKYGWDNQNGGFVDAAYYFKGDSDCTVIQPTKNWWAQAEALNILLMMFKIFPEEKVYFEYFLKQWNYVKNFLIDYENGDWFEGGLDREPHFKTGPKGHIWKCVYHTGRAIMNCITMLSLDDSKLKLNNEGFIQNVNRFNEFINHWKSLNRLT
jgi:mannobiose 2-epimerase